jgi:hypothetical protein
MLLRLNFFHFVPCLVQQPFRSLWNYETYCIVIQIHVCCKLNLFLYHRMLSELSQFSTVPCTLTPLRAFVADRLVVEWTDWMRTVVSITNRCTAVSKQLSTTSNETVVPHITSFPSKCRNISVFGTSLKYTQKAKAVPLHTTKALEEEDA